jgi:heat shock protein HslJ
MKHSILLALGWILAFSACQKSRSIDAVPGLWRVASIQATGESRQLAEAEYILNFGEDGSLQFRLDVNDCGGNYQLPAPGRIRIERIMCTRICCDSPFAIQLTQLLPAMDGYVLQGNQLTLSGAEGVVRLVR